MTTLASKRKPYTIHEKDIKLDRDALKMVLDSKSMEYIDLYYMVCDEYGTDISYKGFMSLLKNRSNWKLIYAWAIADVLSVDMKSLFEVVKVDIPATIKEKEKWNEIYGKNKGK